jgi:phosphatidylinositol phospholipase C delta
MCTCFGTQAKNLYAKQDGQLENYAVPVDAESSPTGDSQTEMSEFDMMRKGNCMNQPQQFGLADISSELKQDFSCTRSLIQKAKDKIKDSAEPAINKAKAQVHRSQSPSHRSDPPSPAERSKEKEKENEKVKMTFALASLIVYTVGVKCRGFNKKECYAVEHVFSLSERMANKILKESTGDLVKHNRTHLVRVYPKGTRLNSSNYEPHRYWASGTQLVAINWQTFGAPSPLRV